jgi:hypothetical protein
MVNENNKDNVKDESKIMNYECGKRRLEILDKLDEKIDSVVGGKEVVKGRYNWKESVRVRNGGK